VISQQRDRSKQHCNAARLSAMPGTPICAPSSSEISRLSAGFKNPVPRREPRSRQAYDSHTADSSPFMPKVAYLRLRHQFDLF
jgi:hypothetical protein